MHAAVIRLSKLARRVPGGSRLVDFAKSTLQSPVVAFGMLTDPPHAFVGAVPDRFAWNMERYKKQGAPPFEDNLRAFLCGNERRNSQDLARFYFLTLSCDRVAKEAIPGAFAELGVYKGNTAFVLAQTARRLGRGIYLFDTFEGFDESDLAGVDADKRQEFEDTSLPEVKALVGESGATFVKGYFPGTTSTLPDDLTFALVHLDCDLYEPFRAGLEYFYPRLSSGGFLIMHDYCSLYWDGVERAIDEFFADKPEHIVLIPDKSGTAVIRKI
jgi:hypothetical protein